MTDNVRINASGTMSPDFQIGKNGPTIYQGTGAPSGLIANAVEGDLYIRTDVGSIYQLQSSSWMRYQSGSLTAADIIAALGFTPLDAAVPAATANALTTARQIGLSGDVVGGVTFDGSANATITTSLANSGVTSGTYSFVTVDEKGRVTSIRSLSSNDVVAALGFTPLSAATPSATANALTTARTIELTGDTTGSVVFDGSANVAISATLTNSGVTAGTYTKVTVDQKGRVASGASLDSNDVVAALGFTPLDAAQSSATANALTTARLIEVTGDATGSASFDGSANVAIAATLANSGVTSGTYTKVTVDQKGRVTSGASLASNDVTAALGFTPLDAAAPSATANALTTARLIEVTGDATGSASFDGSANVAIAATLANSGVTSGTYTKVTVDEKGRVTTGASLASNDVTAALGFTPLDAASPSATANALTTARLIEVTGDATGSASFDGSANVAIAATLANSGVAAGTYTKVSVDEKGRVTTGASLASNDVTVALGFTPLDAASPSATANALTTARLIEVTGDTTGSASFDGSANVAISTTLANSGVTSGTYTKVTVDEKGRVTTGASLASNDVTAALGFTPLDAAQPSATANALTTARLIEVTGDATGSASFDGSANVAITATLANSGVTSGTYTKVTVDGKGRVTTGAALASGDVTTALGFTPLDAAQPSATANALTTARLIEVTGDATGSASFDGSANVAISATLANSGVTSGTYTKVTVDEKGRVTTGASLASADVTTALGFAPLNAAQPSATANALTTARLIEVTGDATGSASFDGSANVAISATLANSGVTSGTYTKVTVDQKGRVTSGASLASADVTTALGFTPLDAAQPSATANALTTARLIEVTGDATGSASFDGSANVAITATLANSGATAGTYGNATILPTVTVDEKGRVTAIANTAITYPVTSVAGKTGAVSIVSADITDATSANTASKIVSRDASGNFSAGVITADLFGNANTATALSTARTIELSGDAAATGSFDGTSNLTLATTLANSGVTAGTYSKVTVDEKGRVTAGNTISSNDVVTALGFTPITSVNPTFSTDVVFASNVAIQGTMITVDASTITIADPTIMLGNGSIATNDGKDRGIFYQFGTGSAIGTGFFGWDNSTGRFTFIPNATDTNGIASGTPGIVEATLFGNANTATVLATARTIALSGDATASGTFDGAANLTLTTTLANSGVTAGTYSKVTVDAKGRVTTGTAISASDVTTALGYTPINPTAIGNTTVAAPITFSNDVTVSGTFSTADEIVAINTDAIVANDGKDVGIQFSYGNNAAVKTGFFGFDNSTGYFTYIPDASLSGDVVSGTQGTIAADLVGSVTGNASTATKLTTARTVALSGDATATGSFDGSANLTLATTLATTGVSAGTYNVATITVDAKGRITAASNGTAVPTTASGIAVSATGSISATDVQAALAELDSEKLALAGGTMTGSLILQAATTSAAPVRIPHGAAPSAPTNGDIWTTTSGIFARVNGASLQLSDTTHTHAASAITSTATGNLAATDVQSALAELDSEKLALSGGTLTGIIVTATATSSSAGFRLPHGTNPTSPTDGDVWTTSGGVFAQVNGGTLRLDNQSSAGIAVTPTGSLSATDLQSALAELDNEKLALTGGTMTGGLVLPAGTTSAAPVRLPHGSAPTAPTNGDIWTTSSGVFARVNGATVQLDAATPAASGIAVSATGSISATDVQAALAELDTEKLALAGGTMTGGLVLPAGTTTVVPVRIPHGSAPTTPSDGDIWTTSSGVFARVNGATVQLDAATPAASGIAVSATGSISATDVQAALAELDTEKLALSGGTMTGALVLPAATPSAAPVRIPHGSAPTSPTDGDVWTTTAGVFARVNGASLQLSDTTHAHAASAITSTATGNLAATDVQSALTELDTEKLALAGGTMTGGLVLPAGTATVVPVRIPHGSAPTSPTDGDVWTTTAGVFARVNGASLQLSDTTHTHAAAAITSTATGNLVATDVQAALTELDTEKLALAGGTMTGALVLPAGTTSVAPVRIPHGSAPTSPVDGDIWSTTSGLFTQVNGTTIQVSGGGGGASTATAVSVTATGTISATNVQSALAELDTEKLALSGGTMTGALVLPAGTGSDAPVRIPHGSAPTAPTDGDIWTTTGGVFARVNGTSLQLADTTHAHAASTITVSATGSISATDVQAALAELDTEKLALAGGTMTGALVLPAATTSAAPVRIPHGSAPTSPTNGDIWTTSTGLYGQINNGTIQFAPVDGPAFTGVPTAPTATAGANTTQIATTAFVRQAVADLVDSSPSTLDTLNELAAALGDDPNFATTVTNQIATKLALAGGTMTGTLTTAASATTASGLNVPHGSAPTSPVNGDIWTTTSGIYARINGSTLQVSDASHSHVASTITSTATGNISATNVQAALAELDSEKLALAGGTMTGALVLPAATTSEAPVRIPHGSAPTAPVNGDIWTTTAGVFARVNGTSLQLSDTTHTHAASAITSTATGNISATNVQAALAELDAEKLALAGGTMTGALVLPAGTTSAAPVRIPHGSAPTSPTNGDVWTTTAGVFARVNGTSLQLSDTTHTHAASAVTVSAVGNISATDVQAALAELDTEKLALAGGTMTGALVLPAGTTSTAPVRIPHGSAPTSPTNGDVWTTTTGLYARINSGTVQFAPIDGPAFTGVPTAPTATAGANTTQIATTAFVRQAVSDLVDSSPSTLDTLNELAAALGDDPNFATTVTNQIATKLALAGGTMTGTLTTAASATSASGLNLPHGTAPTSPVNGDVWTTTSGIFARINGSTLQVSDTTHTHAASAITSTATGNLTATDVQAALTELDTEKLALTGGTMTGSLILPAGTTSIVPVRIPHGSAPTTATNGDLWTTTSGLFAQINGSTAAFYPAMSSTEFRAKTANRTMENGAYWSGLAPVTLTSDSTIEIDFSTGVNFEVTLTGSQRLGLPVNLTPGQTGFLYVIQSASGNCTLSYNSTWKFVGGTAPTLSTAANTIDRFFYFVRSSTHVDLIATTNMAGTNSLGFSRLVTTSTASTITLPTGLQSGYYGLLVDLAINTANTSFPTSVVPSGWTDFFPAGLTNTGPSQGFRMVMSYKALSAADSGTTITGMNSSLRYKALYIIKPEFTITSVTSTQSNTMNGANPGARTVTTTSGKANFSFAAQVGANATNPETVTPSGYSLTSLSGGLAKFYDWSWDSTQTAKTITMDANSAGSWVIGIAANIVFN